MTFSLWTTVPSSPQGVTLPRFMLRSRQNSPRLNPEPYLTGSPSESTNAPSFLTGKESAHLSLSSMKPSIARTRSPTSASSSLPPLGLDKPGNSVATSTTSQTRSSRDVKFSDTCVVPATKSQLVFSEQSSRAGLLAKSATLYPSLARPPTKALKLLIATLSGPLLASPRNA